MKFATQALLAMELAEPEPATSWVRSTEVAQRQRRAKWLRTSAFCIRSRRRRFPLDAQGYARYAGFQPLLARSGWTGSGSVGVSRKHRLPVRGRPLTVAVRSSSFLALKALTRRKSFGEPPGPCDQALECSKANRAMSSAHSAACVSRRRCDESKMWISHLSRSWW
jgi:hypothetical protein